MFAGLLLALLGLSLILWVFGGFDSLISKAKDIRQQG